MSLNPDCDECGGEGYCTYGGFRSESDGCKTLPCQKCFPDSTWEDLKSEGYNDGIDRNEDI